MANGVKFIRVRGRVVPIRQKNSGGSEHLKLGAMGAGAGAATGVAINAADRGHVKTAMVFGAVGVGLGLGALYKNYKNSIEHGKQRKSVLHGVGRFLTNNIAKNIGIGAGVGAGAYLSDLALLAAKKRL